MRILSSSFWNIICQVNASDVIILEGILVFHDQHVRNLMNMKIFVDTGLSPYLVVLEIVWCVFVYDQKVHALHEHIKVLTGKLIANY